MSGLRDRGDGRFSNKFLNVANRVVEASTEVPGYAELPFS